MPQPPLLLTAPMCSGYRQLYHTLAEGLQFNHVWTTNNDNYLSDMVYITELPLHLIDHTKTNVVVLLTDPRTVSVSYALQTDNFDISLSDFLNIGSPDPYWYQSYIDNRHKVSHWPFEYDDLTVDCMSIFKFLGHYQYVYHADLVRQEYYKAFHESSSGVMCWRDYLTDEQNQLYVHRHGDMLKILGFTLN